MRILSLCKKFPFPARDGETIAITSMIRGLVMEGAEITLLSINTPKHYINVDELGKDYQGLAEIHAVDVDTRLNPVHAFINLFAQESYQLSRFISQEFRTKLSELIQQKEFDIIMLEGAYLGAYLDTIREHSKAPVVLRAHNLEFEIWERTITGMAPGLKRTYLSQMNRRLKRFETDILKNVDARIAITARDAAHFDDIAGKTRSCSVPAALDLNEYHFEKIDRSSTEVAFLASLDWMPNREGLMWLVEEVWPIVLKTIPDAVLHVAGRNAPASLKHKLPEYCKWHGEVEDQKEYLMSYPILLVPVLSGSGMRIKILEGMALGRVIISTSIGAEGVEFTNRHDLIIADSISDFAASIIEYLCSLDKMRQVGQEARISAEREYSIRSTGAKTMKFLTELSLT